MMRKNLHRLGLLLFGLILSALATPSFCAETPSKPKIERPNFVIIYIDDMGYGDIGPFGVGTHGDIKIDTPNLDRMAKEGRRFTDFYVTQPVCSASRAGLMTGCYNVRVGILGALRPTSTVGINAEETTIAEVLKQKGYATGCFGKWHLGHQPKFLPTRNGFDEYYGLPYSNDMWPYLYGGKRGKQWPELRLLENEKVVDEEVTGEDQCNLTTDYTKRAVSFIERHKDQPFFVYLPHSMVHVPLYVSDKFKGKSKRGLFGDVVMEVDWSVGQILDTLRKHKLDKKTLVIFTADNGPWLCFGDHAGTAGPLREGKGTIFDGGCREPTVMWWPGTIPADTMCSTPAMTIDLLPTFAYLADAPLPKLPIDGKNIWPLIDGQPGAKSPQEAYYFYHGKSLDAIRMGRWKLHYPHGYRTIKGGKLGTGGTKGSYKRSKIGLSLFDMKNDPGETTNVADQHPDIVAKIKSLGDKMRGDLGDANRKKYPGPGRRPVGKLQPGDERFDWKIPEDIRKEKTPKKKKKNKKKR
jgi:arylsulfatase A-like enzyme